MAQGKHVGERTGFTLIELLVVVGILAILTIAALIAINPLEMQRRSRDSARLTAIARLQSVIETYINDEGLGAFVGANDVTSVGQGTGKSQDCANNWVGVDLCQYLKQVPMDPQNDRSITVLDGTGGRLNSTAGYAFFIDTDTGDYEICTYLEAENNNDILADDSGNQADVFENGTNTDVISCSL